MVQSTMPKYPGEHPVMIWITPRTFVDLKKTIYNKQCSIFVSVNPSIIKLFLSSKLWTQIWKKNLKNFQVNKMWSLKQKLFRSWLRCLTIYRSNFILPPVYTKSRILIMDMHYNVCYISSQTKKAWEEICCIKFYFFIACSTFIIIHQN